MPTTSQLLLATASCLFLTPSCRRDPEGDRSASAFSPSEERLVLLESMPDDHPLIVMKLLKFRGGDGRALYENYLASYLPLLRERGGEFLFLGSAKPYELEREASHGLFGLAPNPWDLVAFERLRSRQDLRKLRDSAACQAAESALEGHLEDMAVYALNGTLYGGRKRSPAETVVAPEYPEGDALFELNLLRFKPDGGEERYYDAYAGEALRLIRDGGAGVIYGLKPEVMLLGDEPYDRVVLVMYPSEEVFGQMISSDDYQAVAPHREEALEVGHLFGFRNAGGGLKRLREGR